MNPTTTEHIVTIAKIATPLISALVVKIGRPLYDRRVNRKSKAVEDLEFLSEFLALHPTKREPLIVEQAFSIHFKTRYDYEEIISLYKFKNKLKSFYIYPNCRHIVNIDKNGHLTFLNKFSSYKKRRIYKIIYLLLYFVLAYLGIFLVLYADDLMKSMSVVSLIPLIICPIVTIPLAISALKTGYSFKAAEILLEEQEK